MFFKSLSQLNSCQYWRNSPNSKILRCIVIPPLAVGHFLTKACSNVVYDMLIHNIAFSFWETLFYKLSDTYTGDVVLVSQFLEAVRQYKFTLCLIIAKPQLHLVRDVVFGWIEPFHIIYRGHGQALCMISVWK